jgi:hypothetical protein
MLRSVKLKSEAERRPAHAGSKFLHLSGLCSGIKSEIIFRFADSQPELIHK